MRDSSEHAVVSDYLRDCLEDILAISKLVQTQGGSTSPNSGFNFASSSRFPQLSPTRVETAWYSELLSAATRADEHHPTWLRFELLLRGP
jgi:hypothetical protein